MGLARAPSRRPQLQAWVGLSCRFAASCMPSGLCSSSCRLGGDNSNAPSATLHHCARAACPFRCASARGATRSRRRAPCGRAACVQPSRLTHHLRVASSARERAALRAHHMQQQRREQERQQERQQSGVGGHAWLQAEVDLGDGGGAAVAPADGADVDDAEFLRVLGVPLDDAPPDANAAPAPPAHEADAGLSSDTVSTREASLQLTCLDASHACSCTRCTPPPAVDEASAFVLRSHAGALRRARRLLPLRRVQPTPPRALTACVAAQALKTARSGCARSWAARGSGATPPCARPRRSS